MGKAGRKIKKTVLIFLNMLFIFCQMDIPLRQVSAKENEIIFEEQQEGEDTGMQENTVGDEGDIESSEEAPEGNDDNRGDGQEEQPEKENAGENSREEGDLEEKECDMESSNEETVQEQPEESEAVEGEELLPEASEELFPLTKTDSETIKEAIPDTETDLEEQCNKLGLVAAVNPDGTAVLQAVSESFNTEVLTIPEGITEIGEKAFFGNMVLREVILPESITKIGKEGFWGCAGLEKITFSENLKEISDRAFMSCPMLDNIVLPSAISEVPDECFFYCTSLKQIVIPNGVKRIGVRSFYECSALQEIRLPDSLEYIGEAAFSDCSELQSIILPASVTDIPTNCFWKCEKLQEIYVPEGVVSIGAQSFTQCISLNKILLPQSLKKAGMDAFGGCIGLKEARLSSPLAEGGYGMFRGCSALESFVFPAGTKTIPNAFLNNCTSLKEVILPDGVEKIGDRAFTNCKSLKEIKIPESVGIIEEAAFAWCESLTTIKLPEKMSELANSMFASSGVEEIDVSNITVYGNGVFNSSKLKNITLNETITSTEGNMFNGCMNLEVVNLPPNLRTIRYSSFAWCGLEEIEIPDSVTSIEFNAFAYSNLAHIEFPKDLVTIGEGAWKNLKNLQDKELVLPEKVETIGAEAFAGLHGPETVDLTNLKALKKIEANIFWDRSSSAEGNLKNLRFPYGLFNSGCVIDAKAFNNTEIESITIVPDGCGSWEQVWETYGDEVLKIPDLLKGYGLKQESLDSVKVMIDDRDIDIGKVILQKSAAKEYGARYAGADSNELWEKCLSPEEGVHLSYNVSDDSYTYKYNCNNFIDFYKDVLESGCFELLEPEGKKYVNAIVDSLYEACREDGNILPKNLTELKIEIGTSDN